MSEALDFNLLVSECYDKCGILKYTWPKDIVKKFIRHDCKKKVNWILKPQVQMKLL